MSHLLETLTRGFGSQGVFSNYSFVFKLGGMKTSMESLTHERWPTMIFALHTLVVCFIGEAPLNDVT